MRLERSEYNGNITFDCSDYTPEVTGQGIIHDWRWTDFYCEVLQHTITGNACRYSSSSRCQYNRPRAGLASKRGRDRNGGDGKASSMKCWCITWIKLTTARTTLGKWQWRRSRTPFVTVITNLHHLPGRVFILSAEERKISPGAWLLTATR